MANEMAHEPTKDLVTGLLADAKDLATGHLGRMQHEISGEFKNLKSVMTKIAISVGAGVVGAILVGQFLAYVLVALGLPIWASYGIAAVVLIAVGFIALKLLPSDMKDADLVPEESIAKMKHDLRDVSHAVRP
jgi:hypothetical protein